MRIAIFHNLPSGGAKRSLQGMVRGLARENAVEVYSLESADHDFADLRPYVRRHEVLRFNPGPLLRSPFGRLNQVSRLVDLWRLHSLGHAIARRIDQNGYDVALVHPCRYENSPSVLCHLRQTPSVFYCHEPLRRLHEPVPPRPYLAGKHALRRTFDRLDPLPRLFHSALRRADYENLRRATLVLVNSEHSRERVRSVYGAEAGVSYPGVDTVAFHPMALPRSRAVLAVGSVTPLKGHDLPIQALSRVHHRRRPDLWIASNFVNPDERAYLEAIAQELDVALRLEPAVDDARLVQLYNQAAITVFVPIREPLGLVALESMACGTAVVGANEGGIPEVVVDGVTGILVPRDPQTLAEAILRLLEDPAWAAACGESGRRRVVTDWSWESALMVLARWLGQAAAMPQGGTMHKSTSANAPETI